MERFTCISLGWSPARDFQDEEDEHRGELERGGGVEDGHLQSRGGEEDSRESVGKGIFIDQHP